MANEILAYSGPLFQALCAVALYFIIFKSGRFKGDPGPQGNSIKGDPGPKGDSIKGDPGEVATIEIGSVESVPSDAPPQIFNAGTPQKAVLHFRLPRGRDGADSSSVATSRGRMVEVFHNGVFKCRVSWGSRHHVEACEKKNGLSVADGDKL